MVTDPLAELEQDRLERLVRAVTIRLGGRSLHAGGPLHDRRLVSQGFELQEHRRIQPGDDPRSIDWRASARSRHLLVRRYRDERAASWLLLLDCSASMGWPNTTWRLAAQLTAALSFVVMTFGHRVGIALFSDQVLAAHPPGRGQAAYVAQRRLIAETRPVVAGGASRPESCVPIIGHGSRVVLISDCLRQDGMTGALARLSRSTGALELIGIAAAEAVPELPESDRAVTLVDSEDGTRHSLVLDGHTHAAMLAERDKLLTRLGDYCRRHGIRWTMAAPHEPWDWLLIRHLLAPERRR